jgi:CheY-like chemotaxis protein
MTTPRTILVVDDNDVNRQLTVDVLRWKGFTVLEATSGQDALDRIKSDHPDLVILDIQLPRMSGLEVMRQLRGSPDKVMAGTKVLAATALAMPDDRERCLAVGCNDYLARPFSFKMLSDRIAALMQTTTLP